jgi:hypothetical protein
MAPFSLQEGPPVHTGAGPGGVRRPDGTRSTNQSTIDRRRLAASLSLLRSAKKNSVQLY